MRTLNDRKSSRDNLQSSAVAGHGNHLSHLKLLLTDAKNQSTELVLMILKRASHCEILRYFPSGISKQMYLSL